MAVHTKREARGSFIVRGHETKSGLSRNGFFLLAGEGERGITPVIQVVSKSIDPFLLHLNLLTLPITHHLKNVFCFTLLLRS